MKIVGSKEYITDAAEAKVEMLVDFEEYRGSSGYKSLTGEIKSLRQVKSHEFTDIVLMDIWVDGKPYANAAGYTAHWRVCWYTPEWKDLSWIPYRLVLGN
jgi:hypothetical protein